MAAQPIGRVALMFDLQVSMTPSSVVMSPAAGACPREQSVAAESLPIAVENFPATAVRHADSSPPLLDSFASQPSSPASFFFIAATIFESHLLAVRGSPEFMTAALTALSQASMAICACESAVNAAVM